MSESRSIARLASRREQLEKGPAPRRVRPSSTQRLPAGTRLLLGSAPDFETSLTIMTIASAIRPLAFRDPVNGLTTPFEVRAFKAGMITALPERELFRRETYDGALPGDRSRTGLKPRKPRLSARLLEVHRAKVEFTNAHPPPGHIHPRSKRPPMVKDHQGRNHALAAYHAAMNASVPAARDLDAD